MLRLPERIHKRPFVVSISVLLTLFVLSGLLILTLGLVGSNSDLMRVHVYEDDAGSKVAGVGINLSYLPTANLLKNPSFENKQYDQIYTVFGGTDNSVYVEPDSGADTLFDDGFFVGGSVRIMSLDQYGRMETKMQSGVSDFRTNQLGLLTPLAVPSGVAEGQKITSISTSSSISVAVGENGLIISDITSSNPTIIDIGVSESFTSSSCVMDRFYAVTKAGTFANSVDGKTWTVFKSDPGVSYSFNTVSSLGKTGVAAGEGGAIQICSGGSVFSVPSGTTNSLLTSAGDGSTLVIAGTGGDIIASSNGVVFRSLTEEEMPAFSVTPNWQCSEYRNGLFVLGADAGQIAIGSYSTQTGRFSFNSYQAASEAGIPLSIKDILLLTSGEIIIRDNESSLYCSSDSGNTWKLLSMESIKKIDEIGQTSSGKIILSEGVMSQTTQLYTRIQFDDIQNENIFQAGDMCFLQRSSASQNDTPPYIDTDTLTQKNNTDSSVLTSDADLWQSMGENTTLQMQNTAPLGCGNASLRLTGSAVQSSDQAHYISQVIQRSEDMLFHKDSLYQIKVWLKQEGIRNNEVMAWISGAFSSAGTTFTDVGSSWRQYTYTFFLPSEATGEFAGEIRFNIGYYGNGVLDIDKVYFGLESYSDSSIPESFTVPVIASAPDLIRLDNIGLGQMGVNDQAWVLSSGNEGLLKSDSYFTAAGCNSLDASLSLVRDAGADPWIVIGSAASQPTIEDLMAYLCGSISDFYGKLRIENGTAVPWSMQFSRLVIEISDSDNIFSTDLQRGAYVDYMIKSIQSSPYYIDVKDKFVFVDAMIYEGGTMLSEADYHASSLKVTNLNQTAAGAAVLSFAEAVSAGYAAYYDAIPRSPSRLQQGADEWIRSSEVSMLQPIKEDSEPVYTADTVTAAYYTHVLLSDLGKHTYTILSDLPVSKNGADADTDYLFSNQGSTKAERLRSAQNNKTLLSVITFLGDAVNGTPVQVKLLPPILSGGLEDTSSAKTPLVQNGLNTYGFKFDSILHTVVANTTEQPALFLIEADWSLKGVYVSRYSSEGFFLEKSKLAQRNNRITLLPGEVMVAEIPIQ